MRIVITGSNGQLGRALQKTFGQHSLLLVDLPDHDITDLSAILAAVRAFEPDLIIHTAALTDVDGCEKNPDLAYAVNVLGSRNMAVAALACDVPLVHISTDYVFDGMRDAPYDEYDAPHPLSVYAQTKALAERVVCDHLNRFYIVRVAWLYGDGPRNFVKTVLRLADTRPELHMVTDEIGSPTYALDVARALVRLTELPAYGIYHLTNEGTCSRYEWAREILRLAGRDDVTLVPSQNYPRAARVPKRVSLRNRNAAALGIRMRPWQEALADYMAELGDG